MKCPKCKAEINCILNVQSGFETWKLLKNGDYEHLDFDVDDSTNDFCCPDCKETIFYSEEDALKALNRKK